MGGHETMTEEMTIITPKIKKKVKEIIGDSTGIDAARRIAEWFR